MRQYCTWPLDSDVQQHRSVLEAAIFDLDGVVTLTARVHFLAWKHLFDDLRRTQAARSAIDRAFDEQAYRTWVDGKPRIEGLRSYLAAIGLSLPEGTPDDPMEMDTIGGLMKRKNAYFLEILESEGAQVDHEAVALIRAMRARGIRTGLATSSRNAMSVLRKAELSDLFDASIDGIESARLALRGKPNPDVFLECAKRLGSSPQVTVLFEDAPAGVQAAKAGAFGLVIGIDRGNAARSLRDAGAYQVVRDFRELSLDALVRGIQ